MPVDPNLVRVFETANRQCESHGGSLRLDCTLILVRAPTQVEQKHRELDLYRSAIPEERRVKGLYDAEGRAKDAIKRQPRVGHECDAWRRRL
jgi:hypothetical protein